MLCSSGNKEKATAFVSESVSNLSDEKPNAVQIVLGDMPRCNLPLHNYHQYVSCHTHQDKTLDLFYCKTKNAYKAIKGALLKNGDHNMVYIKNNYHSNLNRVPPKAISSTKYSADNLDQLNTTKVLSAAIDLGCAFSLV